MSVVRKFFRARILLLLPLGTLIGCGAIYTAQKFEKSVLTYGYNGNFKGTIEVVSMDLLSARTANSDGYVPKSLPKIFSQTQTDGDASTREKIAAADLDIVAPAIQFDLPDLPAVYDGSREILSPVLRNESHTPFPAPVVSRRTFDFDGPGRGDVDTRSSEGRIDLSTRLDRPKPRRQIISDPLPNVARRPYVIGVGDVISLQMQGEPQMQLGENGSLSSQEVSVGAQRLLVQRNGEIFVPKVGPVMVAGRTLANMRRSIVDRLVANRLGFNPSIEIVEFASKTVAASGLTSAKLLPITVRSITLGEAVVETGGFGSDPSNTIVRVLRAGRVYEMSGDQILESDDLANRSLLPNDVISVSQAYDVDQVIAYFDQQMSLRSVENARAQTKRDKIRFQIELETYRFEAERLRQESELARLKSQRESNQLNEEARVANIEARQAYLDRLRELDQLNRAAQREASRDQREILIANMQERARERRERREILIANIQERRERIKQERELFSERIRHGAFQQDHVTIAGETTRQTVVPLPLNGKLTLNRVIYGEGGGINIITGDPSEIYVIRTPKDGPIEGLVTAYHLDASNPVGLAVSSIFEMRPNDVVYVNPQPITNWNRVLTQLLPSTGLLQSTLGTVGAGL